VNLTCDQLEAVLPELLDGSPDGATQARAAEHLATCDRCRLTVEETGEVRSLGRAHGRLRLPDEARRRILDALESETGGGG